MASVTVYQESSEECYGFLRSLAEKARKGNEISFMNFVKEFPCISTVPVPAKPCTDKGKNTNILSAPQQKLRWIYVAVASSFPVETRSIAANIWRFFRFLVNIWDGLEIVKSPIVWGFADIRKLAFQSIST